MVGQHRLRPRLARFIAAPEYFFSDALSRGKSARAVFQNKSQSITSYPVTGVRRLAIPEGFLDKLHHIQMPRQD